MRAVRCGSYSSAFFCWITNWVKVSPMLIKVEDVQALVNSGRTTSWFVYCAHNEPRKAMVRIVSAEGTLRERRFAACVVSWKRRPDLGRVPTMQRHVRFREPAEASVL